MKNTFPAMDASADRTMIPVQTPNTYRADRPECFIPAELDSPSGTFSRTSLCGLLVSCTSAGNAPFACSPRIWKPQNASARLYAPLCLKRVVSLAHATSVGMALLPICLIAFPHSLTFGCWGVLLLGTPA